MAGRCVSRAWSINTLLCLIRALFLRHFLYSQASHHSQHQATEIRGYQQMREQHTPRTNPFNGTQDI